MKSTNVLKCLPIILFLTMSCARQNTETRNNSTPQPQKNEIHRLEQPKPAPSGEEGRDCVPGEVLVKFKDGTDQHAIEAIQTELHLRTVEVMPKLNVYRMKIQDGSSVEETIRRLEDFREVEYSEPNYIVTFQ